MPANHHIRCEIDRLRDDNMILINKIKELENKQKDPEVKEIIVEKPVEIIKEIIVEKPVEIIKEIIVENTEKIDSLQNHIGLLTKKYENDLQVHEKNVKNTLTRERAKIVSEFLKEAQEIGDNHIKELKINDEIHKIRMSELTDKITSQEKEILQHSDELKKKDLELLNLQKHITELNIQFNNMEKQLLLNQQTFIQEKEILLNQIKTLEYKKEIQKIKQSNKQEILTRLTRGKSSQNIRSVTNSGK